MTEQRTLDRQDIEAWNRFLGTVRVGGALPVTFRLDGEWIVTEMIVPFVEAANEVPQDPNKMALRIAEGFPVPVTACFRWPPFSAETAANFIREIVQAIYRHEIDEQIYIAGQRPFAPEHS